MTEENNQQSKGDEKPKGDEGKGKEPVPYERFAAENARRHKAEQELETLKKSQAERDENALKEQKKFEELYNGAKPKAELADALQKTIGEYFADETKDLTDEQKALIPEGAQHTQLAWVKKAKAAGVFGKQSPKGTFNGKLKNGLPPEKWYLELESGDPKIAKLTSAQYVEWKEFNKGKAATIHGGF